MSNQAENEKQQPETVAPEEVRQFILAEIEASKQAIAELSDEELEEVAGGAWQRVGSFFRNGGAKTIWNVTGDALGKGANGLAIYGAYSAGKQSAGTPPQTPHQR